MPNPPTKIEVVAILRDGCLGAIGAMEGELRDAVLVAVPAAQILRLIEWLEAAEAK